MKIGRVCLFLSSKFHEVYWPSIKRVINFDYEEFLEIES